MNKVLKAIAFAHHSHGAISQLRKFTGEDYIVHPEAVANILLEHGIDDDISLSIAWLHDVVEDCPVNIQEIYNRFGYDIAFGVDALTKQDISGNRARRNLHELSRISTQKSNIKSIKCADCLHNLESIIEHDVNFARIWVSEKLLWIPSLNGANEKLYQLFVEEFHQANEYLERKFHEK